MAPKVSVVMAVYNGERYLAQAVESILAQSFTDFEFIIIDDGSTDATPRCLTGYSDSRLKVVHNDVNLGLTKSLNRGLSLATGDYVARMDADDISMQDRLATQLAFLEHAPQIGLVGCHYHVINEGDVVVETHTPPVSDEELQRLLLCENPLCHGAVTIRRTLLEDSGGYDNAFRTAQDYDLWLRLAETTRFANVAQVLYKKRTHAASISVAQLARQNQDAERAIVRTLQRRLAMPSHYSEAQHDAVGWYYFKQALWAYGRREPGVGQAMLASAVQWGAQRCFSDAYWLLWTMRCAQETRPDVPLQRASVDILHSMSANLPHAARPLQTRLQKLLSLALSARAFEAAAAGDRSDVWRSAIAAIRRSPDALKNRGLLTISMRAALNLPQKTHAEH